MKPFIHPTTAALLAGAVCLTLGACASAHPPVGESDRHTTHDEAKVRSGSHDGADAFADVVAEEEPTRAKLAREEVRSAPREFLGWGKREKDPFDHIARPVTSLQFHHPFIRNEARAVAMIHKFPETSATGGGGLNAYALQLNLALTDTIVFTAYKDGYVDFNPDALPDTEGTADIAFGLKAAVHQDGDSIFATGLGYETKSGSADVLEGQGKGVFDAFGSYATSIGEFNVILTGGFLIPTDTGANSRQFHYHAHVDRKLTDQLTALFEVNGQHIMSDAHRNGRLGAPLGIEGFDYTDLGATGTKGNDIVTVGLGLRYQLDDDISVGGAYELSVTDREDLFQDRITLDLVLRF